MTTNNHQTIHSVDLVDLCAEHDTPLFVFDEERLRNNYRHLLQAFKKYYAKTIVCYSIKTNYNLAICRIMEQEGAYAEASSGLDFHVARAAGFAPQRIIFDGLHKSECALREAVESGVLIVNVESFSELERIDRIADELGSQQDIGIRVNPFKPRGFSYEAIMCNPSSRFGFAMEDAYAAFERAVELENLQVKGVLMHPYNGAVEVLLPFARRVHDQLGVQIEYLNLGGGFDPGTTGYISTQALVKDYVRQKLGFGSKLIARRRGADVDMIASAVTNAITQMLGGLPEPTIMLEPGRYIVSNAGVLLVKVNHIKRAGGYKWAVVDGGTNLVPHFKEQREIRIANRINASPSETVNIVGPILFPVDFIAMKRALPAIHESDILAISDCGAYTLSKSTQFLYPRPAALLVNSSGRVVKIRERETAEDVTRLDRKALRQQALD